MRGRLPILIGIVATAAVASAQTPPARTVIAATPGIAPPPANLQAGKNPALTSAPLPDPGEKILPISLPTALKLAGARPLDIQIADQQVVAAVRQYDRAKLLWVPNIVAGVDLFRHEGGQQNFAGEIVRSSRGSAMVGVGPNVVVSLSDAIFAPLAAKQDVRMRNAQRQAAENDSTLAVVEAYFSAQQARGELAGALLAVQRADEVAKKAEKLGEGLAPPLEASRARVELARRQQAATTARERWRIASAELARLLRLEPGTLLEPIEPPFLPVTVVDATAAVDSLIPLALTNRPELAGQEAVVAATLARLKQEKLRPLIPSLALRSTATNPSGSLGYGGFGGGANDRFGNFGSRFDIDFQVLWEFQSLGFGNKARVGERQAEHQAATLELFRTQDRIAAEVVTAFAQAKAASERMTAAEPALKEAVELIEKSLLGMGQTRRIGETQVLIVRPLEVVAAVQAFAQANADFYSAVSDYNRAQFRLYRALGHPPQNLLNSICEPTAVTAKPVPSRIPTALPPVSVKPPVANPVRQATFTESAPSRREDPRFLLPQRADGTERTLPAAIPLAETPKRGVNRFDLPLIRELLSGASNSVPPRTVDDAAPWQPIADTTPPAPAKPTAPTPAPTEEPVTWSKAKDRSGEKK